MPENKVSAVLEQSNIDAINTAIASINTALPFLIDLDADEKKALPKFGDKSVAFVNKAHELVSQTDEFLPRNFDVVEFKKDVALYSKLYSVLQPLRMLMDRMEDTYTQIGAEAYAAALVVYQHAKLNKDQSAGLEAVIDDLAKRFLQKSSGAKAQNE
jgi:hypothetical protein